MKKCFIIFILIVIFASGCNANNETVTQTATATKPTTLATTVATEEVTVSPSATVNKIFGFVSSIENGYLKIIECEKVFHLADDIGPSGDAYGHDWLEIVQTTNKISIKLNENAQYYFADLMNPSYDSDNFIMLNAISIENFIEVCMETYYGTLYYFEFKFADGILLEAELYLDYYIAG